MISKLKNIKKSTWIKIVILIALFCIYLFVNPVKVTINRIIFLFRLLDVEAIKGYILSFG
ncbi:MAG: TVP38/TMEM64 family protein, partial [Tissierellales bacterium]